MKKWPHSYPPRFSTYEAAMKAMKNDFSEAEHPFEYIDGKIKLRKAYEEARYEMNYIFHPKAFA